MKNDQLCTFIDEVNAKIGACDKIITTLKNTNKD